MKTNIRFTLRPSSLGEEYRGSINLRLTGNGRIRFIALPLKVYIHEWDKVCEKSTNEEVNRQIDRIREQLQRIIERLSEQGREYSIDDVALEYRLRQENGSLLSFTRRLAEDYCRRGQERTARAYLCAVHRLIGYCENRNLRLTEIDYKLIENFERELTIQGKRRNTISFYMRNLRSIYNKALAMKLVPRTEVSPFARVFTGVEATRKRALSKEQINRLATIPLPEKSQNFARRLFLFAFYCRGMSFVDMAYLKKSDLKQGVISYRRKKTGQSIEVKLGKELKELVHYFSQQTKTSPYLLPLITDTSKNIRSQYETALRLQNKRLNDLGDTIGLNHPLTTHVARHSWASLAKEIHTPIGIISESLGHSNQQTTYTYLASFDQHLLDEAGENVNKLIHFDISKIFSVPIA